MNVLQAQGPGLDLASGFKIFCFTDMLFWLQIFAETMELRSSLHCTFPTDSGL